MSADPVADVDGAGDGSARCWCCGAHDVPNRMVRLGNHPEVHLCLGCAHFVHQQAWRIEDDDTTGPAALIRNGSRKLRAQVVRRGWHHNRYLGRPLRWLGRHLP